VRSSLRVLSVLEDEDVITAARAEAVQLVAADPELTDHPELAGALRSLVDEERADYLEKG
jgi:ATP-dependent DNA helicase RecG